MASKQLKIVFVALLFTAAVSCTQEYYYDPRVWSYPETIWYDHENDPWPEDSVLNELCDEKPEVYVGDIVGGVCAIEPEESLCDLGMEESTEQLYRQLTDVFPSQFRESLSGIVSHGKVHLFAGPPRHCVISKLCVEEFMQHCAMRAIYHEHGFSSSPTFYFFQHRHIATVAPLEEAVVSHLDTYEEFRNFLHGWVIEEKQRYEDELEILKPESEERGR